MQPLVISFFTKNTFYESEAQNLIASCEKFNLDYQIEPIESLGSWEYNCCYKPIYIMKKLLLNKRAVLWVDADGVFVQKPNLKWNDYRDIATRIDDSLNTKHPSKVCSMSFYVDYTQAGIDFVRLWKEECRVQLLEKKQDMVWDQKCLRDVVFESSYQAKVHALPLGYCRIYDNESDILPEKETYIMHYQASRLYQKIIDGELIAFNGLENLSGEQLQQLRTGTKISSKKQ